MEQQPEVSTNAPAAVEPPEDEQTAYAALKRIAREWSREQDRSRGFEIICQGVASVMPCDRVYLLRASTGTQLPVVAVFGDPEQALQPGECLVEDHHVLRLMMNALDVMMSSDTGYANNELERRLSEEGLGSALSVVLREGREPLALLVVAAHPVRAYGFVHMRLLHEMIPGLTSHLRHRELRGEK